MKTISPLIIVSLLVFTTATQALENTPPQKTDNPSQHVQSLTPYEIDQTMQSFSKTVHGGVQHVVAKSAGDAQQIKLIQAHLNEMADAYGKGDFSFSERMHGADMPGLAQLKRAKTDDIRFEYKALENGAQIHYSTEYPLLVQALHEWFDAQINDHGSTAIPGHNQHHSTVAE